MGSTTEHGDAWPQAAAWLPGDPLSSLRLALELPEGNPARPHLLHWALGHLRNVVVLRGHADWVMSASFIADGRFVLTSSLDHTVSVWETDTGIRRASFDVGASPRFLSGRPQASADGALLLVPTVDGLVHAGPWEGAASLPVLPVSMQVKVNRAALASDNDRVVTGHADGTVRLSSLSTPSGVIVLAGTPERDPVACIGLSPDGQYAAIGTSAGAIRVWNLAHPSRPMVLPAHGGWVNTVKFSYDSSLLATSSDDMSARLFSIPDGGLVATLSAHAERVIDAVFSHRGDLVATASVDKTAQLFDAHTGDRRAVIQGFDDEVQSVAFSPDDRLVAAASVDGTCRVCYAHNGSTVFELADHKEPVFTAAFAPARNSLVTAGADHMARVWNVDMGQVFWGHQGPVNTAAFSRDGRFVATACEDGKVRLSETAGGEQVALEASHEGAINSAVFSGDSTLLLTAGQDHTAQVTSWQTADTSIVLPHDLEVDAGVFSSDGNRVLTSTRLEAVLWQWRTGERVTTFAPSAEERAANPFIAIIGVDLSRDGSRALTAHYNGARLWDTATGNQVGTLDHDGIVYTAVFSEDGTHVLTGSGDGTARVWDARTCGLLHVLVGPSRQLRCAALSPDGRLAAGGDLAGRLIIWTVADEQVAAVLQQHSEMIMSVAFRFDGAVLLTASDDWTAKAVAIDSIPPMEEVVTMARERVGLAVHGS